MTVPVPWRPTSTWSPKSALTFYTNMGGRQARPTGRQGEKQVHCLSWKRQRTKQHQGGPHGIAEFARASRLSGMQNTNRGLLLVPSKSYSRFRDCRPLFPYHPVVLATPVQGAGLSADRLAVQPSLANPEAFGVGEGQC